MEGRITDHGGEEKKEREREPGKKGARWGGERQGERGREGERDRIIFHLLASSNGCDGQSWAMFKPCAWKAT